MVVFWPFTCHITEVTLASQDFRELCIYIYICICIYIYMYIYIYTYLYMSWDGSLVAKMGWSHGPSGNRFFLLHPDFLDKVLKRRRSQTTPRFGISQWFVFNGLVAWMVSVHGKKMKHLTWTNKGHIELWLHGSFLNKGIQCRNSRIGVDPF